MGSAVSASTSKTTPAMPPPGKSFAAFANVCIPGSLWPVANIVSSCRAASGVNIIAAIPLIDPGTEHLYRKHFQNKLDKIIVGYTGGTTSHPSYKGVCSGTTGHAEAIQITFDPEVVSYESLVNFFFRMHGAFASANCIIANMSLDPTTRNRQGISSFTWHRFS
jgi:hypothetical protein